MCMLYLNNLEGFIRYHPVMINSFFAGQVFEQAADHDQTEAEDRGDQGRRLVFGIRVVGAWMGQVRVSFFNLALQILFQIVAVCITFFEFSTQWFPRTKIDGAKSKCQALGETHCRHLGLLSYIFLISL